jgi:hypothetical protein
MAVTEAPASSSISRHLPKRWQHRKTNNNNFCVGLRRYRWHRGRVARRAFAAAGLRRMLLTAPQAVTRSEPLRAYRPALVEGRADDLAWLEDGLRRAGLRE